MNLIMCRDTALDAINKRTEELSGIGILNSDKLNAIMECCDILDEVLGEFDVRTYSIKIDSEENIQFVIECDSFILDNGDSSFYRLMSRARTLIFSDVEQETDEELIKITLIYDGVWDNIRV